MAHKTRAGRKDYRRCRTGHEIHLEIEDDLYKKKVKNARKKHSFDNSVI